MSTQPSIETINQLLDTHRLLQIDSYDWCCSECEWTAQGWWGEVGPQFGDHLMSLVMTEILPPRCTTGRSRPPRTA